MPPIRHGGSVDGGYHHRSSFTKAHKPFKGASKGKNDRTTKGRVIDSSLTSTSHGTDISKASRANRNLQTQKQKRNEIIAKSRAFDNKRLPPRIIALVPLSEDVKTELIIQKLTENCIKHSVSNINPNLHTFVWKNGKRNFSLTLFNTPRTNHSILDIGKVADIVVFLLPPSASVKHTTTNSSSMSDSLDDSDRQSVMGADKANDDDYLNVDEWGGHAITILKSQGIPSSIGMTIHTDTIANNKRLVQFNRNALRYFHTALDESCKVLCAEQATDIQLLLRQLTEMKLKSAVWREKRSYLLGENLQYNVAEKKMEVTGFLRGDHFLNANRLIHITGHGDYQIESIYGESDEIKRGSDSAISDNSTSTNGIDQEKNLQISSSRNQLVCLHSSTEETRDPLQSLAPVDAFANEQSIIDDDEMNGIYVDETDDGTHMNAWEKALDLQDETEQDEKHDDEKYEEDYAMDEEDEEGSMAALAKDTAAPTKVLTEEEQIKADAEAEKEDMDYPDQVDFPFDVNMKTRLQRYRGLKSLRDSSWDKFENLPIEYSQIYNFSNYKIISNRIQKQIKSEIKKAIHETEEKLRSRKKRQTKAKSTDGNADAEMIEENESEMPDEESMPTDVNVEEDSSTGVSPFRNTPITLTLLDVDENTAKSLLRSQSPLVLFGLYPHEHKVSVVHFYMKRQNEYALPIKSKAPMEFHCGFRRFIASPVYSSEVNKDKNLCHRYFHSGSFVYVSMYARIMFPPASILMFLPSNEDKSVSPIVATGNLHSVNSDRLLLKRIVLTGTPFSVHRRTAVVRHMFYNANDVRWFKPVELWTKGGLVGHIKDARGTKGYMKCVFNDFIPQHDTVCMSLYKRQFPPFISSIYGDH